PRARLRSRRLTRRRLPPVRQADGTCGGLCLPEGPDQLRCAGPMPHLPRADAEPGRPLSTLPDLRVLLFPIEKELPGLREAAQSAASVKNQRQQPALAAAFGTACYFFPFAPPVIFFPPAVFLPPPAGRMMSTVFASRVVPLSVPSARTKAPGASAEGEANFPLLRIRAWLVSTDVERLPETTVYVFPAGAPLMMPVTVVIPTACGALFAAGFAPFRRSAAAGRASPTDSASASPSTGAIHRFVISLSLSLPIAARSPA